MYTDNHRNECNCHHVEWFRPDKSNPRYSLSVKYRYFQQHFHMIAHNEDRMLCKCVHFYKLSLKKIRNIFIFSKILICRKVNHNKKNQVLLFCEQKNSTSFGKSQVKTQNLRHNSILRQSGFKLIP